MGRSSLQMRIVGELPWAVAETVLEGTPRTRIDECACGPQALGCHENSGNDQLKAPNDLRHAGVGSLVYLDRKGAAAACLSGSPAPSWMREKGRSQSAPGCQF